MEGVGGRTDWEGAGARDGIINGSEPMQNDRRTFSAISFMGVLFQRYLPTKRCNPSPAEDNRYR